MLEVSLPLQRSRGSYCWEVNNLVSQKLDSSFRQKYHSLKYIFQRGKWQKGSRWFSPFNTDYMKRLWFLYQFQKEHVQLIV